MARGGEIYKCQPVYQQTVTCSLRGKDVESPSVIDDCFQMIYLEIWSYSKKRILVSTKSVQLNILNDKNLCEMEQ